MEIATLLLTLTTEGNGLESKIIAPLIKNNSAFGRRGLCSFRADQVFKEVGVQQCGEQTFFHVRTPRGRKLEGAGKLKGSLEKGSSQDRKEGPEGAGVAGLEALLTQIPKRLLQSSRP